MTTYNDQLRNSNSNADLPYSVDCWGSKPLTNDDCHTGDEFATLAEAAAAFDSLVQDLEAGLTTWGCDLSNTAYVVIDGPDIHVEHPVKGYKPTKDSDDDWQREFAMQQGMSLGVNAYNDAMGN
jgi:hypothetical protein